MQKAKGSNWEGIPHAYPKIPFGIVHVRTDGRRVLVVTHSGRDELKESHAFNVSEQGAITFDQETRIL